MFYVVCVFLLFGFVFVFFPFLFFSFLTKISTLMLLISLELKLLITIQQYCNTSSRTTNKKIIIKIQRHLSNTCQRPLCTSVSLCERNNIFTTCSIYFFIVPLFAIIIRTAIIVVSCVIVIIITIVNSTPFSPIPPSLFVFLIAKSP